MKVKIFTRDSLSCHVRNATQLRLVLQLGPGTVPAAVTGTNK